MGKLKKLSIKETVPADKLGKHLHEIPNSGGPNFHAGLKDAPKEFQNNPYHNGKRLGNAKPLDPSVWEMPGQAELSKKISGK
jgi:hypothetical protein